jgi:hypothetical protein
MRTRHLVLLVTLLNCGGEDVNDSGLSLPEQVGVWRVSEEDTVYDRETLFDYMNGGAEVYLSYDFRNVLVRRFVGPNNGEIVLDIYDMGSSQEAFGVFSTSVEDPEVGLGQGSEFGAGLLKFWKAGYFVSAVNMGVDEEADAMLLEIGKAVDAAISSTGHMPELLSLLPTSGLNERKTSFFHSDVVLNNRYFIATENVLQLTDETNCVFGEYGDAGENGKLLIVEYENAVWAEEAFNEFLRSYLPEAGDDHLHQLESGDWVIARRDDRFVSIVFEAPNEERASELLSQVDLT